jgi:hypothetical protein
MLLLDIFVMTKQSMLHAPVMTGSLAVLWSCDRNPRIQKSCGMPELLEASAHESQLLKYHSEKKSGSEFRTIGGFKRSGARDRNLNQL